MTATAVCSVSDMPATVLVCLHQDSRVHAMVLHNRVLAVNTLHPGQEAIADAFAGRRGLPMAERLRLGDWLRLRTGAPLLRDSVVALDCEVTSSHVVGTHRVFFCSVVDIHAGDSNASLLYGGRQYGLQASSTFTLAPCHLAATGANGPRAP